jgi:hypothetical protein
MVRKPTPAIAAKQWAKEHPEFTGILYVDFFQPKGTGGRRGISRCQAVVYVNRGRAERSRSDRRNNAFNGVCDLCLTVYPAMVLCWSHVPDPNAGEPVNDRMMPGWVFHDRATLIACPECQERYNAVPTGSFYLPSPDPARITVRNHPLAFSGDNSAAGARIRIMEDTSLRYFTTQLTWSPKSEDTGYFPGASKPLLTNPNL